MNAVNALRDRMAEEAADIRLNVSAVLEAPSLNPAQRWGTALACAAATKDKALYEAVLSDAREQVDENTISDAKAAAALMAMNNVYYRFRHFVEKEEYAKIPARLRMNRLGRPKSNKVDFELFCLAVSAINGCSTCVRAHEKVVIEGGLSPEQVNDAVRIASTLNAAATALALG